MTRESFWSYAFVPRALVNVSWRTFETTLFGRTYANPFGIAPMGLCALFSYRGDVVLARAARIAQVPMAVSGSSLIRLDDVVNENSDA
jgi:L-lactate dehydrogenase (cytochrome)